MEAGLRPTGAATVRVRLATVALLAAMTGITSTSGQSIQESFIAARESLPTEGVREIGNWIFSVAKRPVRGESSLAEEAAIGTALTAADAALVAMTLDIGSNRPAGVSAAIVAEVEARGGGIIHRRLVARGLVTLDERRDDGIVTVVRGLPAAGLRTETVDWPLAVQALHDEGESLLDAALAVEAMAQSGELRDTAARRFRDAIARMRPDWVSPWIPVGFGWWRLPEPIAPKLEDLDDNRLIDLISRRPRDPDAIDELSRRFLARSLEVAAAEVAALPRVRWNPKCREEAATTARRIANRLAETLGEDHESIPRHRGVVAVLLGTSPGWPADRAAPLDENLRNRFDRTAAPDAATLLPEMLDAIAANPSADSASYVAATLLAMGEPDAAIPFARLADAWDGRHPYAAVNLLRALEQAGRPDEAKRVTESLSGRTDLDAWARSEVDRFLALPATAERRRSP